jgi:hypothetical protein
MIDAELLADLRRLVNTLRLPDYMNDLVRNVDTNLVRDIVADNRHPIHPAQDPSAKVSVQGAGVVKTGDVGPQHRPIDTDATTDRSGWVEAKSIDSWRAPGLEHIDRLVDAADLQDRLERVRQLGEAKALVQAEAEMAKQQAELNKKQKEPKP